MLDVDRLSTEELRALDAYEQLGHLNALFGELKRLGDEKRAAKDAYADAKIAALSDPSPAHKAIMIDAQRRADKAQIMLSVRKEQIRILQTILRSVPV